MPAKSKRQLRYAYAVEEGTVPADAKTKKWAKDVTQKTTTTKGLPEKVKPKRASVRKRKSTNATRRIRAKRKE